jgi:hypothetical protein
MLDLTSAPSTAPRMSTDANFIMLILPSSVSFSGRRLGIAQYLPTSAIRCGPRA